MPLKKPIKKVKKKTDVFLSERTRDTYIRFLDEIGKIPREKQTKILKQINEKLLEKEKANQKEKEILQKIGLEKKGVIKLNETQLKKLSSTWNEKNKELMVFLFIISKMPEKRAQQTINQLITNLK